jgi:hypothetical protein
LRFSGPVESHDKAFRGAGVNGVSGDLSITDGEYSNA